MEVSEIIDGLKRAGARVGKVEQRLHDELVGAEQGAGPLLQRDYWAVIRNSGLSPRELGELLSRRFGAFAPPELVRFRRVGGDDEPLEVGDSLEVEIQLSGTAGVRVVHRDERSITMGTLRGHPEAGRITFGAYRNPRGDVIFHIRSRARSSSESKYVGFLAAGEAMQTNTWTDFIDRLANSVGEGVIGSIHVETREIDDAGEEPMDSPTFIATGD